MLFFTYPCVQKAKLRNDINNSSSSQPKFMMFKQTTTVIIYKPVIWMLQVTSPIIKDLSIPEHSFFAKSH